MKAPNGKLLLAGFFATLAGMQIVNTVMNHTGNGTLRNLLGSIFHLILAIVLTVSALNYHKEYITDAARDTKS